MNFLKVIFAVILPVVLASCTEEAAPRDWAAETFAIADDYYNAQFERNPEFAYLADVDLEHHDGLTDNSLEALEVWNSIEDELMTRLNGINEQAINGSPHSILLAQMIEQIEGSIGQRVCRSELWGVNHMGGFHLFPPRLAGVQPVGTPEFRAEALVRWGKVANYIQTEIENLKIGVVEKYLAPKRATKRVIDQVEGLLNLPLEDHPLLDPVRRDEDPEFVRAFTKIITDEVLPAYKAYADYLQNEYLPEARVSLAVSKNPDGIECFDASYRGYTTLKRTAREVFDLGLKTVKGHKAAVIEIGQARYGIDDFKAILKRTSEDPANHFESPEEMLLMFEAIVASTGSRMGEVFDRVSETPAVVRPYPEYLQGTGVSARYERPQGGEPGIFRFDPSGWKEATIGSAQITAVHEAYPGHHMQISYVLDQEPLHPLQKIMYNSANVEGWARYSEALTEEMGLYTSDAALIERRAWPARGMVVDTGIHIFGWSNEKAKAFIQASGRFDGVAVEQMLDRISVWPAQLTSYDSGALEIFALRDEAEKALGDKFDIREFHGKLLENGIIPLQLLRENIEKWYQSK